MLLIRGGDGRDFLQRLSTNDMSELKSGPVRTVLANEKGKIVDILAVAELEPDVLLMAGISKDLQTTKTWLEQFIIMEDIKLEDATGYRHILIGGDGEYAGPQQAIRYQDDWGRHYLAKGSTSGAWLEQAGRELQSMDEHSLDRYRIVKGIPEWHSELSAEYNPLEARLDGLVSWTKGCYIGQEVIARLDTYKKVQRVLVRLVLDATCEVPSILFLDNSAVGALTSVTDGEDGKVYGVGYLKTSLADGYPILKVGSIDGGISAKLREH